MKIKDMLKLKKKKEWKMGQIGQRIISLIVLSIIFIVFLGYFVLFAFVCETGNLLLMLIMFLLPPIEVVILFDFLKKIEFL